MTGTGAGSKRLPFGLRESVALVLTDVELSRDAVKDTISLPTSPHEKALAIVFSLDLAEQLDVLDVPVHGVHSWPQPPIGRAGSQ